MLWANRNGLMYVLDRNTGQFLLGKPFTQVNWMSGFDEKGRPMPVPGKAPTAAGEHDYADGSGRHQLVSAFLQPTHGLVLYSAVGELGNHRDRRRRPKATGNTPMGASTLQTNLKLEEEGYGAVRAFDPKTGERKWEFKMNDITWAGVLTTRAIFCSAADAKAISMHWMTARASCCGRHRSAARSTARP